MTERMAEHEGLEDEGGLRREPDSVCGERGAGGKAEGSEDGPSHFPHASLFEVKVSDYICVCLC